MCRGKSYVAAKRRTRRLLLKKEGLVVGVRRYIIYKLKRVAYVDV